MTRFLLICIKLYVVLPKIYRLPKIHKPNVPLCPIVSFIGTATYQLAKFLMQILVPLVGNTKYTVKNSSEFVELISFIKLGKSESQVSFDVVSLFTSVPLKTAKTIVANRVGDDCTLGERTSLAVPEIMEALDICLQSSFLCIIRHLSTDFWLSDGLSFVTNNSKHGYERD